jgi:riboflavin kinase/FMN adenylyltransferase
MKIIYGSGRIKKLNLLKPVLAIGIFDGVHLGHKLIIKSAVKKAREINGTSVVMTFYPHPENVLNNQNKLALLVSLKHRLKLIEELKVDVCIVINFTKRFADFSAKEFVYRFIAENIKPRIIYIGGNFNFGKNKIGKFGLLRTMGNQLGFKVMKIAPLKISGSIVSSTLIRGLIRKGKLGRASLFLGRQVSVLGKVIRGKGIGRILGFPTANVFCQQEVMPSPGVYAIKAAMDKRKFLGMAFNVGALSSINKIKANLEAHLFNLNKNIYGQEIEIEFYKKIRSVKRFKKQQSLKKQIENDAKEVKKYFRSL